MSRKRDWIVRQDVREEERLTRFVSTDGGIERKQRGVLDGITRRAPAPTDLCAKKANPVTHPAFDQVGGWADTTFKRLPHEDQALLSQIIKFSAVPPDELTSEGLAEAG